jgi:hypothetical protein
MKKLKLLNRIYLSIILIFLLISFKAYSEEPEDIWNIEEKEQSEKKSDKNLQKDKILKNKVYEMQSEKKDQLQIEQDQSLDSKEIKIVGLYDPEENGLDISMWSNSDGNQIISLLKEINEIDLSKDASELLEILLLTNAHSPEKNIDKRDFFEIKSNWLIKNSNLKLIQSYLLNNQIINDHPKLTKYLVDEHLSRSEIDKSCEIFSNVKGIIEDDYLSKFNIYCLINDNKREEAQLLLDLKKELGFKDNFYEKKIDYLMGYTNETDKKISTKTILDFHLSHKTNPKFSFQPKDSTPKQIWKYLSSSNLLDNIQDVELTDLDKIATIEKATHERNYTEKELFDLYKRFQFSIYQLLNIKESTKLLTKIEARALIYQGILITTEIEKKLEFMNALKNSFINEDIENAFDDELRKFLKEMNLSDIPTNYTKFYQRYLKEKKPTQTNIKINNKILHQSKLINYFRGEISSKKIKKELNDSLKKIKKNKKYFFSIKDIILVEALKSDNIEVSKKYSDLYQIENSAMPSDIQSFIDNKEMGAAMLRIVEVIGQDELRNIDPETMYFIISTLNQLDIDPLRNKILLKVLPLKVQNL